MTAWRQTFVAYRKLLWAAVLVLAGLDAAGIYLVTRGEAGELAPPAQAPAPVQPIEPPPPVMIEPPPVASALQSGTLIVISKPSQSMFVFQDGAHWASAPVSTGKRGHATPSGVFPILHKRRHHRSNLYSNAPMPFMQRLTWEGIALHAGRVPGYPASQGFIRLPPGIAAELFKLTDADATTVVIGDVPLTNEAEAQQFALTAQLPVRAQLAPPLDPRAVALLDSGMAMAGAIFGDAPPVELARRQTPKPRPVAPQHVTPTQGPTIQLTAAASQAEAEAHWQRLLTARPELRGLAKRVELATVKARLVYRLRLSGADARGVCETLRNEGVACLDVS